MRKCAAFWILIMFGLIFSVLFSGCQVLQRLISDQKIVLPEITLDRIEVKKDKQYLKWWFYADNIDPTKGTKGNHGAPMALSFIFNIKNPNKVPALLNEINFTVKFEKYRMDIIKSKEKMWIPPGKTNQLRVYSLFNLQSARLNLLVQGGQNLLVDKEQEPKETEPKKENDKKKENWLWEKLQEYWTKIPESQSLVFVTDVCSNFEVKKVTFWMPENEKICLPEPNQKD